MRDARVTVCLQTARSCGRACMLQRELQRRTIELLARRRPAILLLRRRLGAIQTAREPFKVALRRGRRSAALYPGQMGGLGGSNSLQALAVSATTGHVGDDCPKHVKPQGRATLCEGARTRVQQFV